MYVFDATPLIYLGKTERLSLISGLNGDCLLPELVYEEVVVSGTQEGYPDARRIERAVEDGLLDVAAVERDETYRRLEQNERLSEADAAVLALAVERDAFAVVDEQYGRAVADAEGIETRGTAFVVLRLVDTGTLDSEEARRTIDEIVEAGWYCAPDLYARILEKLETLS